MNERDAEILQRYADGETLNGIGKRFGISRERARQVVVKHGGADAGVARAARSAAKSVERAAAVTEVLTAHEETARVLAGQGFTRQRTVGRLVTLFPHLDAEVLDEALRGSSITFDHENQANTFSDLALEAGIWYLLGSELGLKPDATWAALTLPQELLDELGPHLDAGAVTAVEYATILGVIAAAQRHATTDPSSSITGKRYEQLRLELLEAMGLVSAKGTKPWPTTRQTIMKRFGGWNDALTAMGLSVAAKGRRKGMLAFDDDDYLAAISDFVTHCNDNDAAATFAAYNAWVVNERAAGVRRPAGASVRNVFDSWGAALRAAQDHATGARA